jgi:predicted N-acetyltransferase YhbS
MSYQAIPYRPELHREALARLWAENMSDQRIAAVTAARMDWLYRQAPDGAPTTVLAVHQESGEVVGCGTFLPRPTWVGGERRRAAVLCDFAVTRTHRTVGAALVIQRALVEAARAADLDFLFGFPNAKSVQILRRMGYHEVGLTSIWVKPLRSAYKVRHLAGLRRLGPLVTVPLDLGLRAADALRRLRGPRDLAVSEALPSGERVEALWRGLLGAQPVVGERSAPYLDWRYARFVTASHRFLAASRPDGALAAYLAYSVEDGKAVIRDLVALPGSGADEALLLALAGRLRGEGVDSIVVSWVAPPDACERLRRAGFLRRPGGRSLIVWRSPGREAAGAPLLDPSSWLMLDGELDL